MKGVSRISGSGAIIGSWGVVFRTRQYWHCLITFNASERIFGIWKRCLHKFIMCGFLVFVQKTDVVAFYKQLRYSMFLWEEDRVFQIRWYYRGCCYATVHSQHSIAVQLWRHLEQNARSPQLSRFILVLIVKLESKVFIRVCLHQQLNLQQWSFHLHNIGCCWQ